MLQSRGGSSHRSCLRLYVCGRLSFIEEKKNGEYRDRYKGGMQGLELIWGLDDEPNICKVPTGGA